MAGSIGNFVEWFDFGIYGFLAPVLATQFFAVDDGAVALMATFAVFGVAFLCRPLGSLVFGRLGDRIGRRPTLSIAVVTMAIGTSAIGLLPRYDVVGVLAPLLLVLARAVQGFSAGGETGGAITYITEHAPAARRGMFGSWVFFTQALGGLAAALLVVAFAALWGPEWVADWGWRVIFLLALPLGLAGLYLRLAVPETPRFTQLIQAGRIASHPIRSAIREHRSRVLQGIGLLIVASSLTQVVTAFLPAYLQSVVGFSAAEALRVAIAGLVVFLVLCPLFGLLSDRIGRKRVLLLTPLAACLLSLPAFVLVSSGVLPQAVLGGMLLGASVAPFGGAGAAVLSELFPTRLRYSAISLAGAVATSLVGGFTPFALTWIVTATGAALAPAFVVIGLGVVSLWATLLLPETRGIDLDS
ncbi:MHS family MFS transporter [Microbacterium sp. 4R-513]|uniref:MFS transporter n=1 Tax=Microbacterium sp. 4R-513 TaxID=2567934 RepID=UPI0013E18AE0|nr:MFS transporter [Microbacterium sp. 4R-513]QIG40993.1 MHS family MFS transporter [Microbacterium sp. 4R-513]